MKIHVLSLLNWYVVAGVWCVTMAACGGAAAQQDSTQTEAAESQAAGESPAPTDEQIARWIDELDSNRYHVRERATQQLLSAGAGAFDPLLSAANSGRPEPADRAIWILRQLGQSEDRPFAMAALERLVLVQGRPDVVAQARLNQRQLREQACQKSLAKLGGRMSELNLPELGPIRIVHVALDENWRGTLDDLRCLAELEQPHFRIEGAAVGDAEIKLFETMDELALLQIWKTRVTPDAVDSLKERQPRAVVYVRNRAQLGIGGESARDGAGQLQRTGVRTTIVQPGSGAAAADIQVDDVIVKLDGKPIKDFDRLTAEIAQHEPGKEIEATILRENKELTKHVTLGAWPPDAQ